MSYFSYNTIQIGYQCKFVYLSDISPLYCYWDTFILSWQFQTKNKQTKKTYPTLPPLKTAPPLKKTKKKPPPSWQQMNQRLERWLPIFWPLTYLPHFAINHTFNWWYYYGTYEKNIPMMGFFVGMYSGLNWLRMYLSKILVFPTSASPTKKQTYNVINGCYIQVFTLHWQSEDDFAHNSFQANTKYSSADCSLKSSSQCSPTCVTKAMVCVILSVGWCI